jgi:predicted ATPase
MYEAMTTTTLGWALFDQGQLESSIEHMNRGLSAHHASGAKVLLPHFWALLAEALGREGQSDEGLHLLEEALDMTKRTGERYYEAELHRVKGELLLMQSSGQDLARAAAGAKVVVESPLTSVVQAEGCFQRSIGVAQRQQALSWELRATLSLARLYVRSGRREIVRDPLARIYGRFTEGFETADLREARALLDELPSSR